ncbi:hypothetical protein J4Z08_21155 [Citrobacter portucalensis]|uniref:hypothetical protein n=1 Tax=Citrobacter portucalensis TaxID=1639133 RepID=UPI00313FF091
MKVLIRNKLLTIPFVFLVITFLFGGPIAETIISETNLSIWINANKIDNSFRGIDFSFLPGLMLIASCFALAVTIQFIAENIIDAWEYFSSTPPEPTAKEQNASIIHTVEKKEPTLGTVNGAKDKENDDAK